MGILKFENIGVYNFDRAIHGMRNPLNSHGKADSRIEDGRFVMGPNDYRLAKTLTIAGAPHRKFLRQIPVSVDITGPMYWMIELDTYKIGTTMDCSSTMHKITSRPLTTEDFEPCETEEEELDLNETVKCLNGYRELYLGMRDLGSIVGAEKHFRAMKRNLPASYLYHFTWTANYEVLSNIYYWRHNHRLPAWHEFCDNFIMSLPYSEFITGSFPEEDGSACTK